MHFYDDENTTKERSIKYELSTAQGTVTSWGDITGIDNTYYPNPFYIPNTDTHYHTTYHTCSCSCNGNKDFIEYLKNEIKELKEQLAAKKQKQDARRKQ